MELPKFDFIYKNRVKVEVSLQSSAPMHDIHYTESKIKPFRHMDSICINAIDLENEENSNPLISHLTDNKNEKLFKEILTITNKIMYTIRNFGYVPKIHEFFYEYHEFEKVVFLWKVHKSHDHEGTWIPVIPVDFDDEVTKYYFSLQNREIIQRTELGIERWNNIKDALQNYVPLPPEREFIINAADHIGSNNYRLAVVESVIGLEIVLNQFLHLYLRKYKGFSEKKIKKFLPNEFTLSMKLSGLLELTLSNRSLENIDIERVREVVKWRNDFMHSTGNLERGKNHDYILKSVSHVFQLSSLLRTKITELQLLDENSTISKFFPLI